MKPLRYFMESNINLRHGDNMNISYFKYVDGFNTSIFDKEIHENSFKNFFNKAKDPIHKDEFYCFGTEYMMFKRKYKKDSKNIKFKVVKKHKRGWLVAFMLVPKERCMLQFEEAIYETLIQRLINVYGE